MTATAIIESRIARQSGSAGRDNGVGGFAPGTPGLPRHPTKTSGVARLVQKVKSVISNPPCFPTCDFLRVYKSSLVEISESFVDTCLTDRQLVGQLRSRENRIISLNEMPENLLVSYHGLPTSCVRRLAGISHTDLRIVLIIVLQIPHHCYSRNLRISVITKLR